MLIQNRMRHWTKSYDITCDIWMLLQSHMRHWTKSYDITCDIYTGLACVTANVLYIHDICFIQNTSKPARLHFTGGHTASAAPHHTRNVMSCDVKLTSHDIATDIRMPSKGYDVRNGLEIYDINMTSHDVTCDSWEVPCDMTKCHMTSHVTLAAASNVTYDIMWHDFHVVPMLLFTSKIIYGTIMPYK